ncbi:endonuclease/exonuclease/phosphatase family protein [Egicoccus sp. AB-alg2]|uniref:endonuclease/exonuclease/phosphatase family protein n=1 Tax=Egicoccus sp. AB-alg2 TaxID=3242693 RepID=UPI00359DB661
MPPPPRPTRLVRPRPRAALAAVVASLLALATTPAALAQPPEREVGPGPQTVRFATYNTAFSEFRSAEGEFLADLRAGDDTQIGAIAQVIQYQRPDVVQIGEFDYAGAVDGEDEYAAPDAFRTNYLEVSQAGEAPIHYPYAFVAPVNTGVPSGFDLNRDGETTGPDDAWGFGWYEGQYGMLVLSKYPIVEEQVRTFQHFRWSDMPGALLPSDPATTDTGDWYAEEVLEEFPLSSKSHWDVPVRIGGHVVHTLNAHPTPPAFDGEEQRNVRRNHDEIRLWADYLRPSTSRYLYDDDGQHGGLRPGASFVILGDYNDDPCDGDGVGIHQLLEHPRVNTRVTPSSEGGVQQTELQGGINLEHDCPPEHDTADFTGPGNLRVDYALPSADLQIEDAGVFWPLVDDPWYEVVDQSDHRMVWVDVRVPTRNGR